MLVEAAMIVCELNELESAPMPWSCGCRLEVENPLAHKFAYQQHWSDWRRHYQARARWHHHQTRLRLVLAA